MTELIAQLKAAVGAAYVLTEGDLSAYEQDWRKRRRGKALAVVRPGSTAEVAAVVRLCAAAGAPIAHGSSDATGTGRRYASAATGASTMPRSPANGPWPAPASS